MTLRHCLRKWFSKLRKDRWRRRRHSTRRRNKLRRQRQGQRCCCLGQGRLVCQVGYGLATHTPIYTHPFNGPFSRTTWVSRYQKGKTNLDFTEARDSEWQWHQLGHMQVGTSLQTDNHASTPPLSFLQAGCPSCRPTNSVKALKGYSGNKGAVRQARHSWFYFQTCNAKQQQTNRSLQLNCMNKQQTQPPEIKKKKLILPINF